MIPREELRENCDRVIVMQSFLNNEYQITADLITYLKYQVDAIIHLKNLLIGLKRVTNEFHYVIKKLIVIFEVLYFEFTIFIFILMIPI